MARKGRHPKGGRVTPKGTRPAGFEPRRRDDGWVTEPDPWPDVDLFVDLREALQDEEPLRLLTLASSVLTLYDPRERPPFGPRDEDPELSREVFLDSMINVDRVETSGLLAAVAVLTDDEVERHRIGQVLLGRPHRLPTWLAHLDKAEVHRTAVMTDVFGDGENVLVDVRLPTGHELTAVAYVDHNLGTVVKDAFVIPVGVDGLRAQMRTELSDPQLSLDDLPPADARARLDEAIDHGATMFPPFETDTWPACRPLVEWMVRRLPEGGRGYERPEWSQAARAELIERFLASSFAAGFDDDQRDLADTLVWFGCDYGPGDPLRWSPVAVEIVLADWIPRKIVAPVEHLAKAPSVLRAFIAFAHAERAMPPDLTAETLAAVDEWEDDYQATIRTSRPQGVDAILAAMGVPGTDEAWLGADDEGEDEDEDEDEWFASDLEERVGGPEALDTLDDAPLPDEPFDWAAVPGDLTERVGEVLAMCDRCCDDLFDVEHRTAVRRVLARVARDGGDALRRRGRADTAAAALCWAVAKANGSLSPRSGGLTQKALVAHLGVQGSPSSRAATLLEAAGFPRVSPYAVRLGSPAYLVAAERRRIIDQRGRFS